MADETVTPVDFGKDRNEYVRKLSRLLGLVEQHYEDVRKDPVPFLKEAHDEIVRLRRVILAADEAYKRRLYRFQIDAIDQPTPTRQGIETRVVTVAEIEALHAERAIIKAERDGKRMILPEHSNPLPKAQGEDE